MKLPFLVGKGWRILLFLCVTQATFRYFKLCVQGLNFQRHFHRNFCVESRKACQLVSTKTIIIRLVVLVFKDSDSQLGATRLVDYLLDFRKSV